MADNLKRYKKEIRIELSGPHVQRHDYIVLLKEASQDSTGTIIHARYLQGSAIQTNGKNLIPSAERCEVAKWEDALEQLTSSGLVVDRGYEGEVFEITNLGYQMADMIAL